MLACFSRSFSPLKHRRLSCYIRADPDGLEDLCLFDVAFSHEMGSTQGDVVALLAPTGKCGMSEVERGL